MLLRQKTAVIHGAGGAVGSAVARTFAREGATVHLSGRTLAPLQAVAHDIREAGGTAHMAQVDAFSADEVEAHADAIGPVDISFNLIGLDHFQGKPLIEMDEPAFTQPLAARLSANYLTARAAARRMVAAGKGGVLMMITATPARAAITHSGSFGPACAAIEGLARSFAAELGPHGIRVVTLRSAGSPDSAGVGLAIEAQARAKGITPAEQLALVEADIMLRRMPSLAHVADTAAFYASDRAGAMTATVANLTCGAIVD
jgi:NAD(P)-dependent dehydrogenase (short-subunit alcohol dehydrogenase family)